MNDLRDRVVLITGASTGIGAAAALAFARAGCRLALHYNASAAKAEEVAQQAQALGADTLLAQGDLGDTAPVAGIVEAVMSRFGRIDVLVNNAGGMLGRRAIADYTDAHLHAVLALNVTQVVMFVHQVVPIMRRQGGGAIINVSSIAARTGGAGGAVLYAAAKGFISTATHGWARELAADGIRVNAVSPGPTLTPFHVRRRMADTGESFERAEAALRAAGAPKTLLGRQAEPVEIARAILFLAGDEASYITGIDLPVDGGLTGLRG